MGHQERFVPRRLRARYGSKAADVPPKIVCSMPSDRRAPVSNIGIADEL
jgi:hypothetical protein